MVLHVYTRVRDEIFGENYNYVRFEKQSVAKWTFKRRAASLRKNEPEDDAAGELKPSATHCVSRVDLISVRRVNQIKYVHSFYGIST